ncbi:hypothetical protein RirG_021760 [Rhizophagus irregularis DAOM 197198w]|uniref:HCP-like protein n=1 Tax=Rhizophagus irregularis (strain DAOM 197198w) TaxID=1432141 RepID=A0A015LYB2_RHIIW|nr:hypothetical protein RirG_021760 [Rhizophagus irregularis DAOM 197198w]
MPLFHLGYCYINGIGTEIDKQKGFELYEEAEKGNDNAIDLLKTFFYEKGEEMDFDINEVKYWYQKSAEIDNKVALYKLGEIFELGNGVNQNEIKAFYFYKLAAEKGCANGKYKLAYYFLHGIIVDVDKKKAFNLYKEAVEEGHENAQKSLALLLEKGEDK